MARWLRVCLALAVAVPLGPFLAVTGAGATTLPSADLAVVTSPGRSPMVPDGVAIPVSVHNYGPSAVMTGDSYVDFTIPGGTQLAQKLAGAPLCTVIVPGRRWRCVNQVMIYPDDNNPSGMVSYSTTYLHLTIVNKCTTPGVYRVGYANDPKPANNSAPLIAIPTGVDTSSCTARSQPAARATTARPSASPSAVPSASGSPSPSASASPSPSRSPSDALALAAAGHGTRGGSSPSAGTWALVALAVCALAGAGAGGALLAVRRRRAMPVEATGPGAGG